MNTAKTIEGTRMITREYQVRFNTPAFLGDAEQSGRWRTPPFKHLLREWWRVAWAAAGNDPANVDAMRRQEARLFGAAADGQGNRSLLRIRLEHWQSGKQRQWSATGKVRHPEVGKAGMPVGADLYLGYGPLAYDGNSKSTRLKANAAIQADETNTLKLAYPEDEAGRIEHALALMNAFGAIGGRSRNGWGSLELHPSPPGRGAGGEGPPLRNWKKCLEHEWAHAIGRDKEGALIWRTGEFSDWKALMKAVAQLKIDLRTQPQFTFRSGKNAQHPEDRHWLSYPVTNHSVRPWGNNARLPNSLRFKVRRNENGRLYGVIFHMPCKPPTGFSPDNSRLIDVWTAVHQFLDGQDALQRRPA